MPTDHTQGLCRCGWVVPIACIAVPLAKLYELQQRGAGDFSPSDMLAEPHAVIMRCPLCSAKHAISFDEVDVNALNEIRRTRGAQSA